MKLILFSLVFLVIGIDAASQEIPVVDWDLSTVKYPITDVIEETASPYTKVLTALLDQWPPKTVQYSGPEGRELHLRVFKTPNNDDYIGMETGMIVRAPITAVEAVLEDIGQYQHLFPGFKDIHVISADKNRFVTYWENIIPVFFMSNVKYKLAYTVDKSKPSRKVYRTQLAEKKGMKQSDSMIVLEPTEKNQTKYAEYAFFEGDFGVLMDLAGNRIWKESVQAVVTSTLSKKKKAESPSVSNEEILKAAQKDAQTYPFEKLVEEKVVFYPLQTASN